MELAACGRRQGTGGVLRKACRPSVWRRTKSQAGGIPVRLVQPVTVAPGGEGGFCGGQTTSGGWAETRRRCMVVLLGLARRVSDDASTVATRLSRCSAASPADRPAVDMPSSRRRAQCLGERVPSGPSRRMLCSICRGRHSSSLAASSWPGACLVNFPPRPRARGSPPPAQLGGRVPKQKVGEPSPISSTRKGDAKACLASGTWPATPLTRGCVHGGSGFLPALITTTPLEPRSDHVDDESGELTWPCCTTSPELTPAARLTISAQNPTYTVPL